MCRYLLHKWIDCILSDSHTDHAHCINRPLPVERASYLRSCYHRLHSRAANLWHSDGLDFRALSYQSLFRALKASGSDSEGDYLTYLGERYFEVSD